MKYALLIIGEESAWTTLPPEQVDQWYRRISEWSHHLDGRDTGEGQELAGVGDAKSVSGTTVTDGPYLETKEVIGGWEIVSADSIDEAVEYAKSWPGVAEGLVSVEVRRIIEH